MINPRVVIGSDSDPELGKITARETGRPGELENTMWSSRALLGDQDEDGTWVIRKRAEKDVRGS